MSVIQNIFNENTRENLSKTFASIKLTIENLEHTSFTLDTLMQHEKWVLARIFANIESITNNLKNNNEMLTKIITNFSAVSDSLAKSDIKSTIYNANLALTQANEIIGKINRGEGSLGLLINNDSLYRNLDNASRNLDLLLQDLRENPKRYVRFSLFDFGRTVVVDENGKKVKKSKEVSDNTIYKLQIRSARKPIPSNSPEFKGLKDIEENYSDGWYRYTVGGSPTYDDVLNLQNQLSSRFPDAFVVAFSDGKRTILKKSEEI
jgi:phospholipid/cholesterol/gamma-HCH transport system substrate-binding protein